MTGLKTQTSADLTPPANPPRVATEWPDNVRDIGDRIGALRPAEVKELIEYFKEKYGIEITLDI